MATDYDDLSDIDVPGNWTVTTSEVKRVKRTEIDFDQAFNKQTGFVFVGVSALALGLSFGLLFFVRQFPTFVIFLGPVVTVLYLLAAAGGKQQTLPYVDSSLKLMDLPTPPQAVLILGVRPLSATEKAAKLTDSQGSIIQCVNAIWNVFTFTAVFLRFEPWHKGCDDGDLCSASLTWVLLVFVVLEYIWISGVISNIILSVMAGGPYAHWWYGTDLDTRSESIWALKRAVGTSLGSIAFGSLLVTAIEVLHFVLKLFSGGYMGKFDLAPHDSVMLMRIGVDRFEIGFIQGGKEVWRLFKKGRKLKRQGIAALVNDSVVGVALHVSCIGNAVLCEGLSYLYMTTINGSFHIDHWWDW
ncbi:hypothetical protein LQV05_001686 [Cryptococcus neoformans]|nr:hypothetical protein LQV05_001686 [Cryptococcus neoformans]